MTIDPRLKRIVAEQPYPLLFATISGAHVLPLDAVVGLEVRDETVQDSRVIEGLEMDIVSHDVQKFFGLLLKKNGYVLEQLFSPLIVRTTPEHEELKAIARGCITKHHSHHYFGFAETQWKLFLKGEPETVAAVCDRRTDGADTAPLQAKSVRRVKPLLYVYRILLTGIHLMRTGEIQANLVTLNQEFRLPYIAISWLENSPVRKSPSWMMRTLLSMNQNINVCVLNCSPPTTPALCPSCRVMKRGPR